VRGADVCPYDDLANQNTQNVSTCKNMDLEESAGKSATKTAELHNDLWKIIESWDDLPQHIQDAIKTLIDASTSTV